MPPPRKRPAASPPRAWSYAAADVENKVGVVIEVNAETDFVAKNETVYQTFVKDRCQTVVMAQNPADMDALMALQAWASMTVEAALQEKILVIGENMKIRRFARFEGACSAICAWRRHASACWCSFDTDDVTLIKTEF